MIRKFFKGVGDDKVTGSTATLFVSYSNLNDNRGSQQQEYVIKKRNKAIVKKILADFDMEETKRKYNEARVVEFSWDSNDFSFDSTLPTARVNSRLAQLMGTDVIRLNDKNYVEKMIQKLEEEQEEEIKKKEQTLADAEEERVRKLQLEGVIPNPKPRKTNVKQKTKSREKKSPQKEVITQVHVIPRSDSTEYQYKNDQKTLRENTVYDKESQIYKEVTKNTSSEAEQVEEKRSTKPPRKFVRKETSFIRELRDTETVDGLYSMAEKIVPSRDSDSR